FDVQGYFPYAMCVTLEGLSKGFLTDRGIRNILLLARLKPGIRIEQAQASLNIIATRFATQFPESDEGMNLKLYPEIEARPRARSGHEASSVANLFLILAVLVLLLACINVANLLLVRATLRQREMAVRVAMGASRGRLIRQLLTESIVLSIFGGVIGLLMGFWLSTILSSIRIQTDDAPFTLDFSFDWRVFVYAFGAMLIGGIVVGIAPALRASPISPAEVLKGESLRVAQDRNQLRNGLVMAEIAASLMLLIVAGLFWQSLSNAERTDLGFDANNVLTLSTDPDGVGYTQDQGRTFYKELLPRIKALPGVEIASLSSAVPMGDNYFDNTLVIPGYVPPKGQPKPLLEYSVVSPEYFQTLKITVVTGRGFTDADRQETQHIAIINETMAQKYWPKMNPIGQTFALETHQDNYFHVVGVVKDSRNSAVAGLIEPFFYLALAQNYTSLETLEIRTIAAPETVKAEVQKVVGDIAPDLPVFNVRTMKESLGGMRGFLMYRIGADLAAALGMLGLALAVIGVYGVVSYSASQRTHEIGIRMALGAGRDKILKMILRNGFVLVSAGIIAGLLATIAISRLVGQFLVGVKSTDPITYIGVTVILLFVSLLACYLPARRAAQVDPMEALRRE
ncbi:MAG TPA: ADOP family duplicated permease, partial [Blastocatellia bacterium]|nr:ADOP family duplicated permease [Blastocatellia bacterium]